MTIASRRRIYWALFGSACLCLAASIFLCLPVFASGVDLGFLKTAGSLKQLSVFGIAVDSARASASGVIVAALFSSLCIAYILASFRKTVSSEIFFFSFWVLSLGLEVARLLVFRFASAGAPAAWAILATRIVIGGRIIGLLSFFAAGLYAAGFRNEKLGSAIAVIFVAGWALAYSMPINTGEYEATLILKPGYEALALSLAAVSAFATVTNLFYASFTTGEKSYRVVALGAGLALCGEALIVGLWNPMAIAAGAGLLVFGSWLFVSRLHAYYLWQ